MADFRKWRVWGDAHELGVEAVQATDRMRNERTRELCKQLSRSALSIPANIAESSGHTSPREMARFLQYAIASTSETEQHVQAARDINAMCYSDFNDLMKRIVSVRRQLTKFIEKVRGRIDDGE
jgi:four helix bundle protein